jgi:hypothetical protein
LSTCARGEQQRPSEMMEPTELRHRLTVPAHDASPRIQCAPVERRRVESPLRVPSTTDAVIAVCLDPSYFLLSFGPWR